MIPVEQHSNVSAHMLYNYLISLVNAFFKILPIKEGGDSTSLSQYLHSLQSELLGCKGVVVALNHDSQYMSLICILQYLIDEYDCDVKVVKREVFKAISICKKLQKKYIPEDLHPEV